jgi:3-hydroxyacyl-CoA dehydrogenase
VDTRIEAGVALLTLTGQDGNRMGPDLVSALTLAFTQAQQAQGVRAIVLTARGPDFCAGPWRDLPPPGPEDVTLPPVLAQFASLCAAVEAGPKPTVCALHGRVTSAGLALALAAQGRIAAPLATFDLPEPRMGRLPPGSAAVRLAWRLGAGAALALLTASAPTDAARALEIGLVDALDPGDLASAARARALALAASPPTGTGHPGLADARGYRDALETARAALERPLPAHRHPAAWLLDAVEAAQLLPPDQALAFDLVRAEDSALTPAARALAHLARATRRAFDTPERREAPTAGHGAILAALAPPMAARLAPTLLRTGETLHLTAPTREALGEALEAVAAAQMDRVRQGHLTQAQSDDDWQRISGHLAPDGAGCAMTLADAEHADWAAQTLPPDLPLILWGARTAPDHGALALAPAPGRAPRLCELVVGGATPPEAVRQATRLAVALRMTPIRVQARAILPRLVDTASRAAARLRAAGVPAEVLAETGFVPRGLADGPVATATPPLPLPVDRLILLAVINAGARLLEAGTVARPSDLDLALVLGAGWPNWRGGPMAEGDGIGPLVLRHELRQAAALDPALWTPEPLLDAMIRKGWRFEDLNAG